MGMELKELYEHFAKILKYPETDIRRDVQRCRELLQHFYPDQVEEFEKFVSYVESQSFDEVEETYVKTFDVQAVCPMYVGWALFGEDYKRGQFMAQIKSLQNQHDIDAGAELPDHLPNIIPLLTKLDYSDACEIVEAFVLPALEKMSQSFENSENVYQYPLQSFKSLLKRDFTVEARIEHV